MHCGGRQLSRLIISSIAVVLLAVSCLEREELAVTDSSVISFITELVAPDTPQTKVVSPELTAETQIWGVGDTKATISTTLMGNARIIAFHYPDSFNEELLPWDELSSKTFKFNGDELSCSSHVRWGQIPSTSNRLKLFVFTPASEVEGAVLPEINSKGTPAISYILPTDITKQRDIITSVKEVDSKLKQNIPLTFNHALTALKFKMGFGCTVKSITIQGIKNQGVYKIGTGWEQLAYFPSTPSQVKYTITFNNGEGKTVEADEELLAEDEVLMMLPQTVPYGETDNPLITVVYSDTPTSANKTISASLKGLKWEEGRLITYTIYKKQSGQGYIYFDLTAGNVTITNTTYSGSIYVAGEKVDFSGTHSDNNRYYVYQSSTSTQQYNHANTGYPSLVEYNAKTGCRVPSYPFITYNNTLWSDFITNNTSVEDVIEIWDDGANIRGGNAPDEKHIGTAVVRDAGRTHTSNYIKIQGTGAKYDLTIDNIYSVIQQKVNSGQSFRKRNVGGIAYMPSGGTQLTVNFVGDNRMGCLHIDNTTTDKIILQGTGTLTVADADFQTVKDVTDWSSDFGDTKGYISNFWNSAIGNNTDDATGEKVYNLYINGGTIFAGATKTEDCTAIGGGGNGFGQVYITGGIVTAVATSAGTAIGGGMGHTANGGPGEVHISGGNVYAYNFANKWNIPSSAIGGGGSDGSVGSNGTVEITGGNVYAYSDLGTGIGAGSSNKLRGGDATITITGGYIVARSGKSNGIGGGNGGSNSNTDGGKATIRISGNPIIRTGSVGGGKTLSATGKIGSADIEISGGDIQAQFVMASGAATQPRFTMTGGTIRNSYTNDTEYKHVQNYGGAVYMDDGTFTMKGGTISNCLAQLGGAIYIKGSASTLFTMTGGTIDECISTTHGGAVYMEGGTVILSGGKIENNIAQQGNGGGIFIKGGDFEMVPDGTASIESNSAFSINASNCGRGGGIYVTSSSGNVDVDILSGKIINNTSDRRGGGIAVELTGSQASSTVTVGTLGDDSTPKITGNHTSLSGGGLYVYGQNANIIMNGGEILGNTTSGYVANKDVANEGGMVTLNGGQVTHINVTYMPNSNYATVTDKLGNTVSSLTQKIVTATNSKMDIPGTFTRARWEIYAWHTRPDGDDTKGKRYAPGAILNLNSDVTLYALWREIQ